jgi:hypothetical protein
MLDLKVMLDELVYLVLMDSLAWLAYQEMSVLEVSRVKQDKRVNLQTCQMPLHKQKKEKRVERVCQVSQEKSVLKVSLVQKESVEFLEEEEKMVKMVVPESLAFLAWMACLALTEIREILVCQEELAQSDPAVMMVSKDLKVVQDQEAKTDRRENEALSLDLLENLENRVLMVSMDHQESLV